MLLARFRVCQLRQEMRASLERLATASAPIANR